MDQFQPTVRWTSPENSVISNKFSAHIQPECVILLDLIFSFRKCSGAFVLKIIIVFPIDLLFDISSTQFVGIDMVYQALS
jgi:hypothetical protein